MGKIMIYIVVSTSVTFNILELSKSLIYFIDAFAFLWYHQSRIIVFESGVGLIIKQKKRTSPNHENSNGVGERSIHISFNFIHYFLPLPPPDATCPTSDICEFNL